MKMNRALLGIVICSLTASAAFAQSAPDAGSNAIQRNVNQQNRIEQGLQSGELTTHEAGRLERQESKVEHMEAHALKDGSVSPDEQARLTRAQNKVSEDIYRQKHDAQTGNPASASSQRMQANVARNARQQARIEQGVQSGQLTGRETARLEHGEAHVDRVEARQAANGRVEAAEASRAQRLENRESRRIFRQKHDANTKG
jgi:hypothetical protein